MRRPYSRRELLALVEIETEYGPISYQRPIPIEQMFYEKTGVHRRSGCLYMTMWRIKQGLYDEKLLLNDPTFEEFHTTQEQQPVTVQ